MNFKNKNTFFILKHYLEFSIKYYKCYFMIRLNRHIRIINQITKYHYHYLTDHLSYQFLREVYFHFESYIVSFFPFS